MHLWPEMSQRMRVTLSCVLHLSLKAAVLGAQHPEAGESANVYSVIWWIPYEVTYTRSVRLKALGHYCSQACKTVTYVGGLLDSKMLKQMLQDSAT